MRRYWVSVVFALLSVFGVSAACAVDLDSRHYAVYEKGGIAYVVAKDQILILHGDIATPITFTPNLAGYTGSTECRR